MIRRNTQLHALTQSRIQHLPGRTWLMYLTRKERATFIATFGGWALDGMT